MSVSLQPFETEFFRRDGSRVPVLIGVATFEEGGYQGVAFVLDLTERKRAADSLRALQTELAHANRLATLGQLVASIAHEVNQPIGAVRNNAHAALRFLTGDPPDLAEVTEALECMVNETYRMGDIINGIRDQVRKAPPRKEDVNLNDAIEEVIAIVRGELSKHRVSVQMLLADGVPLVNGDRVQLQQVMLNLILNAIEAMISLDDGARELVVSIKSSPGEGLLVAVSDSGPGIAPENRERIFESFYTTKGGGWELASRFAAPLSMPMRGGYGLTHISLGAPFFASRCRRTPKPRFTAPADKNSPLHGLSDHQPFRLGDLCGTILSYRPISHRTIEVTWRRLV